MDMTLSRRGDYAVRAAAYLASAWDTTPLVRGGDISRVMHIPPSYAPQVMGFLLRAGIVTVKNGRGGGYRLARAPSEVSLLEVVEAAEGDLTPRRCPLRGVPCFVGTNCSLHPGLSASMDVFKRTLAATTLADIAPRHAVELAPA